MDYIVNVVFFFNLIECKGSSCYIRFLKQNKKYIIIDYTTCLFLIADIFYR